jgi:hypothetical protein
MATAHQIRDLIAQTATGTTRRGGGPSDSKPRHGHTADQPQLTEIRCVLARGGLW